MNDQRFQPRTTAPGCHARARRLGTALSLVAAVVLWPLSPAAGREPGDPAPPLVVNTWIKGPPVSLAGGTGGHVYVVEFWSTKSPYCRAVIPALTALAHKYADRGVIVVSISIESPATVRAFVGQLGDRIGYRVAVDRGARTTRAYLGGFAVMSIPQAFLIDTRGRVVWIGHPAGGLDEAVADLLAGRLDLARSKRLARARSAKLQYLQMARSITRARDARPVGEKVLAWGHDDTLLLNDFAWVIATEPGLIVRDLDLARRAARRAYDNCKGNDPRICDTYARVLFDCGDARAAARIERRAVELAPTDAAREQYRATASRYAQAAATQPTTRPTAPGP